MAGDKKAEYAYAFKKLKGAVAEQFKREIADQREFDSSRDRDLNALMELIRTKTENRQYAGDPERKRQPSKAPSLPALKRFFRKNLPMSIENIDLLLYFIGYGHSWKSYVEFANESTDTIIEDISHRNDLLDLLVVADLDEGDEFEVKYGADSLVKFRKVNIADNAFAGESSEYLEIMESKGSSLKVGAYALIPYLVVGAPVFAVEYIEKDSSERMFYVSSASITEIAL